MYESTPESWLAQEAEDLIDQGNVGLYQFIWGLRGSPFELSDASAIQLSTKIVENLVRTGRAELYELSWPGLDPIDGPLSVTVLNDPSSWSEGESGPMIGLVPTTR